MLENVSNKALLYINIVLKLLDVGLTTYIINTWGIMAESNVLIRNAINVYGFIPAMIAITVGYVGLVYLLYINNRRHSLFVVAGLMTLLVINNLLATVIQ